MPVRYDSVAAVCRRNAHLDAVLRTLAERVPEHHLHDELSHSPRTLAQQLGHLAESAAFVDRQLTAWLLRTRIVIGRVSAYDPDFHDGIERATELRLEPLVAALTSALEALDGTLRRLHRGHLTAVTLDVVFGREPLVSYLDRHVFQHKATHALELQTTLRGL